ncbi:MAG: bifunctional phosphoribosylaminoimidazolecarboxamide formyltransferase/IMP cyclohydrolase, partial [Chloroflexi bacterium]|nr:bifunctional phosphoribosylaminoimidazolecarboxamide formyltransferase/IMP cyclohydrolase [Chloroflexota bacterium]
NDNSLPVRSISDLTGFPEIMDGRVKTLHPAVHGGILARRDLPSHLEELAKQGIGLIDLVVVNLYPFVQTVSRPNVTLETALENIDIGGPTMIRAAAKNFPHVIVLVDPRDYDAVIQELRTNGQVSQNLRQSLAVTAFQHVASYDTHIAEYLRAQEEFPERMTVDVERIQPLRYGENSHQRAALYREVKISPSQATIVGSRQLQGKELSFNNILDADAALGVVEEYTAPCVAIIKHTNPCGLACGEDLVEAFELAYAGDPVSAFGGIVGVNRSVGADLAQTLTQHFFEVVIAQEFEPEALRILEEKKGLRLLAVGELVKGTCRDVPQVELNWKRVSGGFLLQTPDVLTDDQLELDTVTNRKASMEELTSLLFAWRAVKHVKSNAIVLTKNLSLVGVGAGQMSRVDSVEIALRKAGERAVGSVLASDAFFPFPDGVELAAKGGVTAIIQPGGSVKDAEVIETANRHNVAMLFTGQRHFKH